MATLTIKNIPENLYKTLKHQAVLHHRSLNSEIIFSLEQALQTQQTDVQVILKEARRLRSKTKKNQLTEKQIKAAKEKGRS